MSLPVYVIDTFDAQNNHFGVNRAENWQIRLDQTFENHESAEEHVIQKTLAHSILPTLLVGQSDERKRFIIREFCFDNDLYLYHRRHFIGYPPVTKLKQSLAHQGVGVRG